MTVSFIQIGSVIGILIGLGIWIYIYSRMKELKYYSWMVFAYLIHVLIYYFLFAFFHGIASGFEWTSWSSIIRFQTVLFVILVGLSILQIIRERERK